VFYWDDALNLDAVTEEGGTIDGTSFLNAWRGTAQEAAQRLDVSVVDIEAAKAALGAARLFVLAHRPVRRGPRAGRRSGLCGFRSPPAG
jgi:hypothetical protein